MVEGLEDEDPRAIGHHEAVALRVERARGPFGLVVAASGERAHGAERGDRDLADPRFRPARDHHVRVAAPDVIADAPIGWFALEQALTVA